MNINKVRQSGDRTGASVLRAPHSGRQPDPEADGEDGDRQEPDRQPGGRGHKEADQGPGRPPVCGPEPEQHPDPCGG